MNTARISAKPTKNVLKTKTPVSESTNSTTVELVKKDTENSEKDKKPRKKPDFSLKNRKLMNFGSLIIALAHKNDIIDDSARDKMLELIGINAKKPKTLAELEELYENNLEVDGKKVVKRLKVKDFENGKKVDVLGENGKPVYTNETVEISISKVVDMNMKRLMKQMESGEVYTKPNFDMIIKTPNRGKLPKAPKTETSKTTVKCMSSINEDNEDDEDEYKSVSSDAKPDIDSDVEDNNGFEFEEEEEEVEDVREKAKVVSRRGKK
jgi:hypothetical protein